MHRNILFLIMLTKFIISTFRTTVTDAKLSPVTKRVAVIGGGAAGYFSAIECANHLNTVLGPNKFEVVIFEAGKTPLSKVLISGGGRCNVMHDPRKGPREISKGYPRGNKELLGPFNARFGPDETYTWFRSKGVVLKVEEDGRVFPTTDRSETIIDTLESEAARLNIQVYSSSFVKEVAKSEESKSNPFTIHYNTGVAIEDGEGGPNAESATSKPTPTRESLQKEYKCDRIIFATGSSRKGYDILTNLGHTISPPLPSLFSFKIKDESLTALSGLPVFKATVRLALSKEFRAKVAGTRGGKTLLGLLEQTAPMMITHQGLSGPAILRLSAYGAAILAQLNYCTDIEINWLPGLTVDSLTTHINTQRMRNPNKLLGTWFPPVFVDSDESYSLDDDDKAGYGAYDYEDLIVSTGSASDDAERYSTSPAIHKRSASTSATASATTAATKIQTNEKSEDKLEASNLPPGQLTIPRRLWLYILKRANIDEKTIKWGSLTKQHIQDICTQVLKQKHSVTGRGAYRDEFVTCGGVQLNEIDFEKYQSRKVPGLFLAGEVLDVDGVTGGYNFQAAWTSGWIAGHSCATSLTEP